MRQARIRLFVCALLAGALLAGCAATGTPGDTARKREQAVFNALTRRGLVRLDPVSRIPNFRIDNWVEIDDYHLILTSRRHQHYLLTMLTRCPGLAFAQGIGVETLTGSITRQDSIVVASMRGEQVRCRIKEITALEEISGYVEAPEDQAVPES